jgi:predicted nucleic acid-binding Zn ribbon protein
MPVPDGHKRRLKKVVSLAEALDLSPTLKRLGVRDEETHVAIYGKWAEIVGEAVARNTQAVGYRKGVLTVAVSSSAWLHNLTMMKPQILSNLDAALGKGMVKDLRFKAAGFTWDKLKEGR